MPRKLAPDLWLFGTAVVLLSTGVVMVYSASANVAADRFHDPYFFLKKQIFWAMLGAACLWLTLCVDYRRLEGLVVVHAEREPERSEEHTSELQSPCNLVCRLLLEKKKRRTI